MKLNESFAYEDNYMTWGWFTKEGKLYLPTEEERKDNKNHTHSTILRRATKTPKNNPTQLPSYYELKPEFYRKGWVRFMVEYHSPDVIFLTFSPLYVNATKISIMLENYMLALLDGTLERIFRPRRKLLYPQMVSIGFVDMKRAPGGNPKRNFFREPETYLVPVDDNRKILNAVNKRLAQHESGERPLTP